MKQEVQTVTKINDLNVGESMSRRDLIIPEHLRTQFNKSVSDWLNGIDPTNKVIFVDSRISCTITETISERDLSK